MSDESIQSYESLRVEISNRYDSLSKRLRQIAKFALDHPTDMALETIATISKRAGVQPSAFIRFSQAFGFSGFSEMQRAFKTRIVEHSASYKERSRFLNIEDYDDEQGVAYNLLKQYCSAGVVSLENLTVGVSSENLDAAVSLLEQAEHIYVMAQRRSFPIATYLAYALNHAGCRVHLLDGIGGMLDEESHSMTDKDVLITVTFHSYSSDTKKVISVASEKGTPIIVITDSALSPISGAADVCFEVHDPEVHGFRSLTASMCVAQALATSLVFRN